MSLPENSPPRLTVVPGLKQTPASPPTSADDDRLLASIRRGDHAVAESFYWRVKPIVDRTVHRLLGRVDPDGEDITQLAMIQLIQALPSYRGESPLDAWVAGVSANIIYKHIRRRRIERAVFIGVVSEGFPMLWDPSRPAPTGSRIQARELSVRVATHLSAIEPSRAWAFMLHDVCGYSLAEIAHICGITTTAAQSRLSRGRRDLHERIRNDPELADLLDREGDSHE